MPAGAVTTTACAPADAFGDAQVMRVSFAVMTGQGRPPTVTPTPVAPPKFVPRMSTMDRKRPGASCTMDVTAGVDDAVRSCVTLPENDSVDMLTSCTCRK